MSKWVSVFLILLIVLLAGCGGQTPTEAPTEEATEAATEEATASADEGEETVLIGDAAAGQALFNEFRNEVSFACATCHRVDSTEMLVGPGLLGVADQAATRVEGLSAAEYIHQSIVDPGAYTVEGFEAQAELMPRQYPDIFSEEQISDLVAYVLTLTEE